MDPLLIWGLGLLLGSILLIIIEFFVPSMGIISVLASVLGIAGLVCLFRTDRTWGLIGLSGMIVIVPALIAMGIRIMPTTPFGKRMFFGEASEHEPVIMSQDAPAIRQLLGQTGSAVTDLRPVGTISLAGQMYTARCETSFVSRGQAIKVTGINGLELRVRLDVPALDTPTQI